VKQCNITVGQQDREHMIVRKGTKARKGGEREPQSILGPQNKGEITEKIVQDIKKSEEETSVHEQKKPTQV